MATEDDPSALLVDEVYEFSAPRFYDFVQGESEEDARKAELWFETALSYGPSRTLSLLILFHWTPMCLFGFLFRISSIENFFLNDARVLSCDSRV